MPTTTKLEVSLNLPINSEGDKEWIEYPVPLDAFLVFVNWSEVGMTPAEGVELYERLLSDQSLPEARFVIGLLRFYANENRDLLAKWGGHF